MSARLRVILISLAVLTGVLLWPAAAEAATFTGRVSGTGGQGLFVRPGPSQGSGAPLYTAGEGAGLSFDCYVHGQVIAGFWYTGDIWHHLTSGGWVSDSFFYTGYNGPVPGEPVCGGAPAPVPAPVPTPSPPPAPSTPPGPPSKPWTSTCNTTWTRSITWTDSDRGGLRYEIEPSLFARRFFFPTSAENLLRDLLYNCIPTQAGGRFDYAGGNVNSFRAQIQCHLVTVRDKATYNVDSSSSTRNLAQAIARSCQ